MTQTDAIPLVVAITGASAGVGRATARAFARRGAHIGILARAADRLEATARDVEALGGRAVVVPGDVANPDDLERLAAETERAFGPLDIWVNNAMATVYGEVHEVEPDEFRRATDVTYLGQVYGAQAALRRMRPRDAGTIVFVGSSLAYRGIPLQSAYCGAKHAVQGFFESLRSELIHQESGVAVTMVQLPALNTPQFGWARTKRAHTPRPAGTVYAPEVAADAIVFAATDGRGRREIWVGASTVQAILANRVAPGLLDHYVARTLYEGETTDQPVAPDRADNLFDPVPGDPGADGAFGDEARDTSLQLWATKHRRLISGVALLAIAVLTWRCGTAARSVSSNESVQQRQALGVTTGAEVARLARKGEQVLVRTCVAANARKAVLEDATREELIGDLRPDGPPRTVRGGESLVVHHSVCGTGR